MQPYHMGLQPCHMGLQPIAPRQAIGDVARDAARRHLEVAGGGGARQQRRALIRQAHHVHHRATHHHGRGTASGRGRVRDVAARAGFAAHGPGEEAAGAARLCEYIHRLHGRPCRPFARGLRGCRHRALASTMHAADAAGDDDGDARLVRGQHRAAHRGAAVRVARHRVRQVATPGVPRHLAPRHLREALGILNCQADAGHAVEDCDGGGRRAAGPGDLLHFAGNPQIVWVRHPVRDDGRLEGHDGPALSERTLHLRVDAKLGPAGKGQEQQAKGPREQQANRAPCAHEHLSQARAERECVAG